ncbi:MAG TPA: toll/interleukin-1 receptor domain-containing protein [Ktedonobacteraceae bacterium]
MPDVYLPLSEPWDTLYTQIADAARTFWQRETCHDYGRLQGASVWSLLQRKLHELLARLLSKAPLSPFELFLLCAATSLYESGWQVESASQLPGAQRYILSGQLIRESYQQRGQAPDLGLSKLAPATIEILARLCSLVGQQDLASLSLEEPEWAGYQETVRLRYLVALLQIGDALLSRPKAPYFHNLARFREADEPGLILQSYASFTPDAGKITTHICIHPDDSHLVDKITTIVEEPLRRWWAANWHWLAATLHVTITLQTKPPVYSTLQEPLHRKCSILLPYLQTCQPPRTALPTAEQIEQACARTAGGQQGELPDTPQTKEHPPGAGEKRAIEVFYSYAHQDRRYRKQLETQLTLLKREGLLSGWSNCNIGAGEEWEGQINAHLNTSRIILLLISPDFLASDYAYNVETKRAMERHTAGEACVIPIILRPCNWQSAPFGKLLVLPENGKPVTDRSWHTLDDAFFHIAQGIKKVIEDITTG